MVFRLSKRMYKQQNTFASNFSLRYKMKLETCLDDIKIGLVEL